MIAFCGANPRNFRKSQQVTNAPLWLPIFMGMHVVTTRNLNKEIDYVNGMPGVVTGTHKTGIRVTTKTGYPIVVYPYTDDSWGRDNRVVYFPIRPGYATTLMKVQGSTLDHMTLFLDVPNIEAAGYVALSRVEYDDNWQFVGDPTIHHFTPSPHV